MEKITIYNPFSNSIIDELTCMNKDEIDFKLSKTVELHQQFPDGLSLNDRLKILSNLKLNFERDFDKLVDIALQEGGKPFIDTVAEVKRAIEGIQLCIDYLINPVIEIVPMNLNEASKNKTAQIFYEPIGVVVAISAFNHPVNLIIHQVVTAVAAGCPVLIKPDLRTPLSCLKIEKLLLESGLPSGWAQTIICHNDLAEYLATQNKIAFVNFIGSAKIGWYLRSKIAPGVRCALEHGGIAASIVTVNANIENSILKIVKGAFYHAGQVCVSTQRLFLSEQLKDIFIPKLIDAVNNLVVGNPAESKTEVGPIISEIELKRIDAWVKDAFEKNGQILVGGKILSNNCYAPTVILNPSLKAIVSQQEIFGPVLIIYTYNNLEDALSAANNTPYHFQASVFSDDKNEAELIAKKLKASAVMINNHTAFRVDWMPFGGRKQSGLGIGGIKYSIKDYQQYKLVITEN